MTGLLLHHRGVGARRVAAGLGFRSFAGNGTNIDEPSVAVNVPTGTTNGDLLLAAASVSLGATITAPAGWTLIRSDNNGGVAASSIKTSLYYRVASSEPASYTWAATEGSASAIRLRVIQAAYSGIDTTNPIDSNSGQCTVPAGSTNQVTSPTVTPTITNGFLVAVWANNASGATTFTEPGGMSSDLDSGGGSSFGVFAHGFAHEQLASSSATGTRTCTVDSTNSNGRSGQLVVLKPA